MFGNPPVKRLDNAQVGLIYWLQPGDSSHIAATPQLKCALGLSVGSNMAFTFNNLWPRWSVEGLQRQADRGEPPITCQHCQGQCLIIPSLLATIHVIYHSHHLFFVAHIRGSDGV